MERRNATLEDVARAAGVSRSTVSRVVNRQDQVAPEVRQSVQRVIDRLGYHPHAAARALASGRAGALDLVIIDDHVSNVGTDPYYARVVAGLAGAGVPIRVHLVGARSAPAVLDKVASRRVRRNTPPVRRWPAPDRRRARAACQSVRQRSGAPDTPTRSVTPA